MSTSNLQRTPIYDRHLKAGARMVPFAGFSMPVQYSGVVDEHKTVRSNVGLFDVSHMGEIELRGDKAIEAADNLVTNDVGGLALLQACYTCMCTEAGGIIDDLIVYKMADDHVLLCVNAGNKEKVSSHIKEVVGNKCEVEDTSESWALIAVQGPKSAPLVNQLCADDILEQKGFRAIASTIAGVQSIVSRTGYTGEDGFELYVPSNEGVKVWDALLEAGASQGVKPAGLGSRDSLRLEMGYPLHGNDISEQTNPYEAGLGWVVKLKKPLDFVGKTALAKIRDDGPARRLCALKLTGRGIARPGFRVLDDAHQQELGHVTSGTQSPTLGQAIALAYLPVSHSTQETKVTIDIRGRAVEAEVCRRPFISKRS